MKREVVTAQNRADVKGSQIMIWGRIEVRASVNWQHERSGKSQKEQDYPKALENRLIQSHSAYQWFRNFTSRTFCSATARVIFPARSSNRTDSSHVYIPSSRPVRM